MPASPLRRRSSDKAAALIIALAFVVLLTGLALAYFSRTTTERQLAHTSYNETTQLRRNRKRNVRMVAATESRAGARKPLGI